MEEQNSSLFSLTIDPLTKSHLIDTAKWARFLSVAGLVLLTLGMLGTLLTLTVFSNTSFSKFTVGSVEEQELTTAMRVSFAIFMIIVFGIAFFPLWYLLQFANQMKRALYSNDQELLNNSFLNIKRYFRYVGVIMIIVLAFYAIMFLFAGLGLWMV